MSLLFSFYHVIVYFAIAFYADLSTVRTFQRQADRYNCGTVSAASAETAKCCGFVYVDRDHDGREVLER